jgi:hypothetical protein
MQQTADVAVSVMLLIPTEWWLRPVRRADWSRERHSFAMPPPARRRRATTGSSGLGLQPDFIRAIERRTGPHLADADALVRVLEAADTGTPYFWFLGAHPHAYDTWKAHNEACFRALRAGGTPELTPEPGPEDVAYPADPLRRLVSMQSSASELMTGFTFVSPWPREDARFR